MNNEENITQPEAEEVAVEKQPEPVIAAESAPEPKHTTPFGSMVVMLIAVVCLLVVFGVIYLLWTEPEPSPMTETPEVTEPTEPVETTEVTTPEPEVDPSFVPARDPEILGLRIDTSIGRFFTEPSTGQTLYVTAGECEGECLEDWTPYVAETAILAPGSLRTTERADGTFQYTWNGQGLYTYNLDDERSVLGDGYDGTWRIARP